MATLFEAIKDAARGALCSIGSSGYDLYRLLRNIGGNRDLGAGPWSSAVRLRFCNEPAPYPDPPPPFPSGQCPGVFYVASGQLEIFRKSDNASLGFEPWSGGVYGPIDTIAVFDPSSSRPDVAALEIRGKDQAGSPSTNFVRSVANELFGIRSVTIASVVRQDGQPDTCGDPPAVLPPPTAPDGEWNKREPSVTYTNNDGVDITVPVVLLFGYAKLEVDANVHIPIQVDVGGINFNLDFNLNTGDIHLFPRNNYYGDKRPGTRPIDILPPPDQDIPDYPPSLPPGVSPIDEEGEEEERVIIGAVVTTTLIATGKVSTFFQDENPDISVPNLGYINFLCRVGYLDGAWTEDIPVKNRRTVIRCPWDFGAVAVKGTPRPGVSWVITPLYSKKEQPTEFAGEVP